MYKKSLLLPGMAIMLIMTVCPTGWGVEGPLHTTGTSNASGFGGMVLNDDPSTITGSATTPGVYVVSPSSEVENWNSVTVVNNGAQGGTLLVDNTGLYFNDDGVTTFTSDGSGLGGGSLMITGDGVVNNGAGSIHFGSGSSYSSTGAWTGGPNGTSDSRINNQADIYINTGMASSVNDLLDDITQRGTGTIYVQGRSEDNINRVLDYQGSLEYGPTVVIETQDGDYYTRVDVGRSSLQVNAETGFTGTVDAANYRIMQKTSTFNNAVNATDHSAIGTSDFFRVNNGAAAVFSGASADFQSGYIVNAAGGRVVFQNGATYSSAGRTENSGNMTFDAASSYAGTGVIRNLGGGTLDYSTQMTNFAGIMANTDLAAGSSLNLNDQASLSSTNVVVGAAAAGSTVTITSGGNFGGLNVRNASLYINGSSQTDFAGAVVGREIIINQSPGTTFNSGVAGYLVVNSTGTFAAGSSFNSNDILINGGGTLHNSSNNILISGGNKMDNHGSFNNNAMFSIAGAVTNYSGAQFSNASGGTVANAGSFVNNGVFTNNGTYQGPGSFVNNHQFYNSGTFRNDTASSHTIVNAAGGTMWFYNSTNYVGSGGVNLIANAGTVEASLAMSNASLQGLMRDLDMQAGSQFNLSSTQDVTLNGNYGFGASASGSKVNINPGGKTVTLGTGSVFDAGSADVNLENGALSLTHGSAVNTAADFTVGTKGALNFTQGTGGTSLMTVRNAVFTNDSTLTVGEANTLEIRTAAGVLSFQGSSSLTVDNRGNLIVNGASSFAGGTSVVLGEDSVMRSTGNIAFADNTKMTITATSTGISKIISSGGNIDVSANGSTEVIFLGAREDIVNKHFLIADNGVVNNYDKLHNTLYDFQLDIIGSGQAMYVTGMRSVIDSMADTLGGYDKLSVNKYNGGNYTDQVLASDWGQKNSDLADYIQQAGGLGFDDAYGAYSQLFGEYGAYAATPMMTATNYYRESVSRRMSRHQQAVTDECHVCHNVVLEDPCNACGGFGGSVETAAGTITNQNYGGIWGGAFGDWNRLRNRDNISGYSYDAMGVALGYDYVTDRFAVGFAGTYSNGALKVKNQATKYNADIANVGVYGSYTHESNLYARGYAGFGYGWNDYDVNMIMGGKKEAKFKNQSYSAGLEIGYHAPLSNNFNFIPYAGVDFIHLEQEAWTETIHKHENVPILANRFDKQNYNSVDIPVGVRMNKVFDFQDVTFVPEVRASWVYQANDRRPRIDSGYAEAGGFATMHGVSTGTSRGVIGAGVRTVFANRFALAMDYDFEFRTGYREHNLTGTLSMDF